MLILLLVAGNEKTTTLIQNTVLALLAHPEWGRRARADLALAPAGIEETLRYSSPVQFAPRRALAASTLHGVAIQPNDFVVCWIGSANRDAKAFDHPEKFDPLREKNPHIAFGFGPHYCLGANLARLEARVALEALLTRTSRIERAWSGDLPIHPSPVFRGVTKLPVRLVKA